MCEFVFPVDWIYLKINLTLEMFALSTVPRSRDQSDILGCFYYLIKIYNNGMWVCLCESLLIESCC